MYVADTHALVWYFLDDERLGTHASSVLQGADSGEATVIIPTIVLAETMYLARKKNFDYDRIVDTVEEATGYQTANLSMPVLTRMQAYPGLTIHDAVITSTADLYDATVITQDQAIKDCAETTWE